MYLVRPQLAWTLGALLFLALLAVPRAGLASCGDYLDHAAQSVPGAERKRGDEDGPLKPAPCRGPHCSARTPVPVIPAAPKFTPEGPRHQLYWLSEVPVQEVIGCWKLEEASDMHSLFIAGRLFRPPRAS